MIVLVFQRLLFIQLVVENMKIVWSVLVRLDSFKISCRFCVILWFCFCRFCDRRGSFPPVIWRSKGCRISEFLSPRLQVLHTHSTTHCPLCNGTGNRKRDENLAHLHQHHYNEIKQDKYTTKIIHPSKINYYFFMHLNITHTINICWAIFYGWLKLY